MNLGPLRFWRHLRYHRDIIKHLRWTDIDERRKAFYARLIPQGSLVFDIGANMGNRSKIFRSLGSPVVAFEPQSYCAEFLHVAFSNDPGFELEKIALSAHPGDTTMYLSEAHTLSTLDTEWMDNMRKGSRFPTQDWGRTETVRLDTLEYAIARHGLPSFMKIDVEGHEYQVLSGLRQPVKCVSLEFSSESEQNIKKCVNHLDTLGNYGYRLSLGESMQFESKQWLDSAAVKAQLEMLREGDPLVWGDIYARLGTALPLGL